jgi:hypothetical protein
MLERCSRSGNDGRPGTATRQFTGVDNFDRSWSVLSSAVRYLVKAKIRLGKSASLLESIGNGTLGKGSIAGDEYIYNMNEARLSTDGVATWVETCFCDRPLAEERPYWEEYFDLLSVKDAHARRNCRHENGAEPWACCNCDCTKKLEQRIASQGKSFLETLRCHQNACR